MKISQRTCIYRDLHEFINSLFIVCFYRLLSNTESNHNCKSGSLNLKVQIGYKVT